MRIDAGRDNVGGYFFAALQSDTAGAAVLDEDFRDARLGANLHARFARGIGNGIRDRARAAAAEAPRAERAINFAHVVMQQNISGSRRTNSKKRSDNAGGGHRGFKYICLKPLIEKISGAHGHELNQCVALVGRKASKALHQEMKLLEIARFERRGVRRNHGQHRLHEAAHRRHHLREFVVGFGVDAGMAANFALRARVIVHSPEVISIGHRRERAIERQDF